MQSAQTGSVKPRLRTATTQILGLHTTECRDWRRPTRLSLFSATKRRYIGRSKLGRLEVSSDNAIIIQPFKHLKAFARRYTSIAKVSIVH